MKNIYLLCFVFHAAFALRHAVFFNVVERSAWSAIESNREPIYFTEIPKSVVVYQSSTPSCNMIKSCTTAVQALQHYDMEINNWDDIRYNFLVAEDGNIYEGRGWRAKPIDASGYYSKSLEICFIGTYENQAPNSMAIDALKNLLTFGVSSRKLNSAYNLFVYQKSTLNSNITTTFKVTTKKLPHWKTTINIIHNSELDETSDVLLSRSSTLRTSVFISYINEPNCTTFHKCPHIGIDMEGYTKFGMDHNIFSQISLHIPLRIHFLHFEHLLKSYNFLIDEDGHIFEGTGWSGYSCHNTSICIALIGNFTDRLQNPTVVKSIENLLHFGEIMGSIASNYSLYEQNIPISDVQFNPEMLEMIRSLPNWRAIPNIIRRWEWNGGKLKIPVKHVLRFAPRVYIYQLINWNCITMDTCKTAIKDLQDYSGYMPYNFFIDESGKIYRDGGWLNLAHERRELNETILEICVIGNFTNRKRFPTVLYAIQELLNYGVAVEYLSANYVLYGFPHSEVTPNSVDMYHSIKKLPHWKDPLNTVTGRSRIKPPGADWSWNPIDMFWNLCQSWFSK